MVCIPTEYEVHVSRQNKLLFYMDLSRLELADARCIPFLDKAENVVGELHL